MAKPQELVEALASTVAATATLCADLTDERWARPTGCPGWSVHDTVAHLVGLEAVLAGGAEPDHELVGEFPHAQGPMAEYMERHVDVRRARSSSEVLQEFNDVFAPRLAQLRALDDAAFDDPATGPMGSETTLTRLLPIRIFDCWAHEQDIRRAVGRRGGMHSAAADVALGVCKRNGGRVAASALPEGSTLVFRLAGAGGGDVAVAVRDGKASSLDEAPAAPTVTLGMDTETFAFLCCGRADARPGPVAIEGDAQLGEAVLAHLGFTP